MNCRVITVSVLAALTLASCGSSKSSTTTTVRRALAPGATEIGARRR